MVEISPEDFKEAVLERRAEVLMILYMDATRRWAEWHLNLAKAEVDVEIQRQRIQYLETLISQERARSERIAKETLIAENAEQAAEALA